MSAHDVPSLFAERAERGTLRDAGDVFDDALTESATLDLADVGIERSPHRSRPSRARYVAAAVVAAAVGVGGAFWLRDGGDDQIGHLVADGSAFCQAMSTPMIGSAPDATIYLHPGAPAADVDQVEAALSGLPGLVGVEHRDTEETRADFRALFADDPTMLENVTPTDLPTSFELRFDTFDGEAKTALRDEVVRLGELIYEFQPAPSRADARLIDHIALLSYRAENRTTYHWSPVLRSLVEERLQEVLDAGEPLEPSLRSDIVTVQGLFDIEPADAGDSVLADLTTAADRVVEHAEIHCDLVVDPDFGLNLGGEWAETTEAESPATTDPDD